MKPVAVKSFETLLSIYNLEKKKKKNPMLYEFQTFQLETTVYSTAYNYESTYKATGEL